MPSPPRPKQFVAARDVTFGRIVYRTGDPVTDPRHIAHFLARDRGYIRSVKPAPAESPAEDSATTPPAEPQEG